MSYSRRSLTTAVAVNAAPTPSQGADDTPNQGEVSTDAALAQDPLSSRPVPAPRVNPIRNDSPYPANDPCTYLG